MKKVYTSVINYICEYIKKLKQNFLNKSLKDHKNHECTISIDFYFSNFRKICKFLRSILIVTR